PSAGWRGVAVIPGRLVMKSAALVAEATDLERLQGAWVSTAGKRHALLLIAGSHFLIRFKEGDLFVGSVQVDESCYPKHMDMRIEEGSARYVGKTALRSEEHTSELQSR